MNTALEDVAAEAAVCTRCRLSSGRTTVVFSDGSPDANLMFIGEGPGYHEDQQGLPFVGASGQLLNTLLGEVGMARDDVYIANVVKCRPPGNRDPLDDEIDACRPYLSKQIELVDPTVIVTLGNFATRFMLESPVSISKVRGQKHALGGRVLIPTFHPAAVLRGGGAASRTMQQVREDFSLMRATLDEARTSGAVDVPEEQLGLF